MSEGVACWKLPPTIVFFGDSAVRTEDANVATPNAGAAEPNFIQESQS